MPEKQPTEGYILKLTDEDDVEGHNFKMKAVEDEADVEGHNFKMKAVEDDDVEGHAFNFKGGASRGE